MWSRAELKAKAKIDKANNYWPAVVVGIILAILIGQFSINFNSTSSFDATSMSMFNDAGILSPYGDDSFYNDIQQEIYDDPDVDFSTFFNSYLRTFFHSLYNIDVPAAAVSMVAIIALFGGFFYLLLKIFLFNPLIIGCRKWFLNSKTEANCPISTIVFAFSSNYFNCVKIMFLKDLYTFLWSLLCVIPGIVKSYEYRMIPYLLAENTAMDSSEAFSRTKTLMTGNKADTFVLELSFIGWSILSSITCSLVGIFYLFPYKAYTDAELYIKLCSISGNNNNSYNNYNGYDYTNNDNLDE